MENNNNPTPPLKLDNTKEVTPKQITLKDVKPGQVFRLARTGTTYVKNRDGSIRNLDKAIVRQAREAKKHLIRLGHTPEEANKAVKEFLASAVKTATEK